MTSWQARVERASIWIDAQPPAKPNVRGVVELALEGGPEAVALSWTARVGDATVKLVPEGWDGSLAAKAKRGVELVFEDGPPLAEGASATIRVELRDGHGATRALESTPCRVQKVQ